MRRPGRSPSGPRQHLWDEAVLHLAQLGREHLWRLTVGIDWMELRDESAWIALRFLPVDRFSVVTGLESSDESSQEYATDSYARALEIVEQLARRL
jgi:hypothetical protein